MNKETSNSRKEQYKGLRFVIFDSTLRLAIARELANNGWITNRSKKLVTLDAAGTVLLGGEKTNVRIVEDELPLPNTSAEDIGIEKKARFKVAVQAKQI